MTMNYVYKIQATAWGMNSCKNLFYDNDLGNSGGVDLLADLSLINQIIFNEPLRYLDRGTHKMPKLF